MTRFGSFQRKRCDCHQSSPAAAQNRNRSFANVSRIGVRQEDDLVSTWELFAQFSVVTKQRAVFLHRVKNADAFSPLEHIPSIRKSAATSFVFIAFREELVLTDSGIFATLKKRRCEIAA